jgi:hypothetical protein
MLMAPLTLSAAQRRPGLALDGRCNACDVSSERPCCWVLVWQGAASTALRKPLHEVNVILINDASQRIDRDQCTEGKMHYSSSEVVQYHSGCIRWDHLVWIAIVQDFCAQSNRATVACCSMLLRKRTIWRWLHKESTESQQLFTEQYQLQKWLTHL